MPRRTVNSGLGAGRAARWVGGVLAAGGLALLAGCDGKDAPPSPSPSEPPAWRFVTQPPCEGRVQDKVVRPITALARPGAGGTYRDPAFGTFITRVTAVNPAEGENAIIKPAYSTMPAWNADESLLILWHRNKGHELYEGEEPYRFLRSLPITPTDIEHVLWDPIDPDVFYYPSSYNYVPALVKYQIGRGGRADSMTVLRDFSTPPTNCPTGTSSSRFGLGADPEWMGYGPRKLIGLMCGPNGSGKFVYSIAEDEVIAGAANSSLGPIAPIPAPSEQFVYLGGGFVLDTSLRLQRRLTAESYFEHANVGRSALGYDTWNAVAFEESSRGANDQGSLISHRLDTGEHKVVIGLANGYPYPPSSTHISANAVKAPGWVAVGMVGTHTGNSVLDNEIVVANVDTGQVCRVAHARTFAGTTSEGRWGYWSETHLNISRSGTRILWGSDWMNGSSVDTYVVDLRKVPR